MTAESRDPRTDDSITGSRIAEPEQPSVDTERHGGEASSDVDSLLPREQEDDFRGQWEVIQTGFVDEPRRAVEQADRLVAGLTQQLAETFSERRDRLEQQWDRGDEVSTEELRVALQRYRSFFDRLLRA